MTRVICLSAISVNVRRLIASEDTTIDITGSESGSTFVITGGRTCGGTSFMALATFSRTSFAASLRSRSSTNRTVICALPSVIRAEISSMPATPLSVSSIGSTTDVAISSGLVPGSDSETLTVAGSALGNRSTPRSRNEKIPSTTSDITSIVANTGRRTQISDNISESPSPHFLLGLFSAERHLHAIGELVDIVRGNAIAGLDAADDLDAIAEAVADFELAHGQLVTVDEEHAVDAIAVLQRRVRQRQHVVHLAALDVHARERARLEHGVLVGHERLEGKRARRRVHRRTDPRNAAGEGAVRIGIDEELHGLAVVDPRRHLFGNLGDHLQRIDADDGHHRHLRLHELAEVDEPLLDVAVERRPDRC